MATEVNTQVLEVQEGTKIQISLTKNLRLTIERDGRGGICLIYEIQREGAWKEGKCTALGNDAPASSIERIL